MKKRQVDIVHIIDPETKEILKTAVRIINKKGVLGKMFEGYPIKDIEDYKNTPD